MDEQNQGNNAQNAVMDDEQLNNASRHLGNAGKAAAKKGAKVVGEALKKLFDFLLKVLGPKGIIILAAVLILVIVIILAVTWLNPRQEMFNGTSEILGELTCDMDTTEQDGKYAGQGQAKGLFKIEDRAIVLDTEEFDKKLDEFFKNKRIDPQAHGISKDYSELKEFLKAEAMTLYPDFRTREDIEADTPIEEGKLEGCVQFNRQYGDGTSVILEYMPYDEFATELAKFGIKLDESITQEKIYESGKTPKSVVEAKYNELKDKFTLDLNQNLVIVELNSDETVVTPYYSTYAIEENMMYSDGTPDSYYFTLEEKRIPYQDQIKKYSLPFELCMAILLTTDNPEFSLEVAKLAQNSKIIQTVYDDTETNIYTTVFSHKSNFSLQTDISYCVMKEETTTYVTKEEEKQAKKEGREPRTSTKTEWVKGPTQYESIYGTDTYEANAYETIVETVVTVKPKVQVEYADTWIANIQIQYALTPTENVNTTVSDGNDFPELEDDEGYTQVEKYHDYLKYPDGEAYGNSRGYVDVKVLGYSTSEQRVNKKKEFTTREIYNTYNVASKVVKETPEKFLSLLRVDPTNLDEEGNPVFNLMDFKKNTVLKGYRGLNKKVESPMENWDNARALFYQFLGSNDKTKDLVETFKYLMLLYKGRTTYDESRFSLYEPNEFINISRRSYYGGNAEEKVWFAIKGLLQELGYIDCEYAVAGAMGNTYVESGFHTNNLENSANGKSGYSDEEFTSRVDSGQISKSEFLKNYSWSPYNDSSAAGCYGYGLAQWTSPGRKERLWDYTVDKGLSISDLDGQVQYLIQELRESSGKTWFKNWATAKDVKTAAEIYCKSFEVGVWSNTRWTQGEVYYQKYHGMEAPSGNSIVQEALQYVGNRYIWGGDSLTDGCDCSHFVWLILKKCGIIPENAPYYTTKNMPDGITATWGARFVGNNPDEAQEGDIIIFKNSKGVIHHTAFYSGNGLIVEAQGKATGITCDRKLAHGEEIMIYRIST